MAAKPENLRRGNRLRAERRARHWDKTEMARRLAAELTGSRPNLDSLISYIKRWEAGSVGITERYVLAYLAAFEMRSPEELFADPAEPSLDRSAPPVPETPLMVEALDLATWLEASNVGAGTVRYLSAATRRLGYDYPRRPPVDVLTDAFDLQRRVTALLRGGRQRLAQTRALLETSAELFALIALLAGDVGRYAAADAYAHAGWTCADEADSDWARALVLCAQSKTARQEDDFTRAAELARRGVDLRVPGPERILLGACEATALQSAGDIEGAHQAMRKVYEIRDGLAEPGETSTAWTCPLPRQAAYAVQVGLGANDPKAVLRAVGEADERWAAGDPWVYGTWAQVRIGAALAHEMSGEVEGAVDELGQVFDLGAEYRVTTITMRMGEVGRRLRQPRWAGHPVASNLRERIRDFHAGSLEQATIAALNGPETA